MADAHANFAVSTVATAPSPAASGTSLVVASGEGTRFPAVPFNAVIAPVGALATPANSEVIRVTARSTDTLGTIVRAQEGSSARTVVVGDRVYAGPTKKTFDDIESIPQSLLDVHVDYVNGSDSNNGRSWANAYKTIQAAYDALVTYAVATYSNDGGARLGVGRIHLAPGNHDVGTGLLFDSRYSVEMIGTRSGRTNHNITNSGTKLISTSAAATEFVKISNATSVIGLGFGFREVAFTMDHTVNTSLTKIIYAKITDYLRVERCSFFNADGTTNVSVVAIYQEDTGTSGGDGAWARITENNVSRLALYKAAVSSGSTGNFNRSRIRDNVIFYGGSLPMIELAAGGNGLLCDGNNFEGSATGVKFSGGAFTQCTFLNNSGEDPTGTNPFYDVDCSCSQMIFMGGTVTSAGVNGIFVRFNNASAYNNLVIGPYDANGSIGNKRKVVDNSTSNGNVIIHPNHRVASKYKAGAGVTALADSDFTTNPPPNGTTGIAHNTTTGLSYLSGRANGAWKSVQMT